MPLNIHTVGTLDEQALEPYRTLKRPLEHRERGFFVTEGEKVVRRLLESRLRVLSLLLTQEWFEVLRPSLETRQEEIQVYIADKALMETIVGFHLHNGIMAMAGIPAGTDVASIAAKSPKPLLFVALDGIMNSENMGVIVRNCVSLGVQAVLVGESSCDPYLRRSVRNSMGNVFSIPIVYMTSIVKELGALRSSFGMRIIGAHPREGSLDIGGLDFSRDCCIVFGSEGEGISEAVLRTCDTVAKIPMMNDVDSINVGSASAVFLYEAQRQRTTQRTMIP